jgi:hypothetical protein
LEGKEAIRIRRQNDCDSGSATTRGAIRRGQAALPSPDSNSAQHNKKSKFRIMFGSLSILHYFSMIGTAFCLFNPKLEEISPIG